MKEKIFIINFFDKKEMKWYSMEESKQIEIEYPLEIPQKYRYEHTKWYHETGNPPIEAPIDSDFTNEFVQLPPLVAYEEFQPYIPFEEDEE